MRYAIFSHNNCPILNINSIGYAKDPAVTRCIGPRDQYIIHYVLSGKGYFNGSPVGSGEGFLITPKMMAEYYCNKKEPWEFVWIISEDYRMKELFEYYQADCSTHIFQYNYVTDIRNLANRLISDTNKLYTSFEMLELFLSFFKYESLKQTSNEINNTEIYFNAAKKYINSNISMKLTVCELTEFLGISQPYLYKIFKEKLALSPKQYINNCKINHSIELLEKTNLTITQISNSVGFGDALSFSKFFRLNTGLSPQNYRKRFSGK